MKASSSNYAASNSNKLDLHDAFALGEFEAGLSDDPFHLSSSEVERLPLLLRILSSARPLASISSTTTFVDEEETLIAKNLEGTEADASAADDASEFDHVLQHAVERMEDRAALYVESEGVEVVACQLAEKACRQLGIHKLQATSGLAEIAQGLNPISTTTRSRKLGDTSRKRKLDSKQRQSGAASARNERSDHLEDLDDDELSDVVMTEVVDDATAPSKRPHSSIGQSSIIIGDDSYPGSQLPREDSPELTVQKTIMALAQLVVEASALPDHASDGDHNDPDGDDDDAPPRLQQLLSDSLLAQARSKDIQGNDLGSTVASILQHAPILKHKTLASALCRAAFPQASLLIGRMGANCPTTVPCLLRGCLEAYQQQQQQQQQQATSSQTKPNKDDASNPIAASARNGIVALASLSARECSRVRATLRKHNCFLEVQLELALRQSPLEAACFLIEQLSSRRRDWTSEPELPKDDPPRISVLQDLLMRNSSLMARSVDILAGSLNKLRSEGSMPFQGDIVLTLRAMGLLLNSGGMKISRDKESDNSKVLKSAFDRVVAELKEWMCAIRELSSRPETRLDKSSQLDLPFSLLIVTTFILLAVVVEALDEESTTSRSCCEYLRELLQYQVSDWSNAFVAKFLSAVRRREPTSLINETLRGDEDSLGRWRVACELVMSVIDLDIGGLVEQGTAPSSFLADVSASLELVASVQASNDASMYGRLNVLLDMVVNQPVHATLFLKSRHLPKFVEGATAAMATKVPVLPLVSPLRMETMGHTLVFPSGYDMTDEMAHFILRLVYCYSFLRSTAHSVSPFAFDPRTLPLKHIRRLVTSLSADHMDPSVRHQLLHDIDWYCPEVESQALFLLASAKSRFSVAMNANKTRAVCRRQLLSTLRNSLDNPEQDLSGRMAEESFFRAMHQLGEMDLCTVVVGVLLAEPKLPPRFVTYMACCRDPCVLLKCPVSVWAREGLRRIVLFTLGWLVDANDHIVNQYAHTTEVKEELLNARDAIIIKSLVAASSTYGGYCSMTLHTIRKAVARKRGLFAMLLKQSPSESLVDWVVERVPEAMYDKDCMSDLLTNRCSMTTPQRLVAADGILRVVIAHGHQHPHETKPLIYSALAQLVASFFLLVGPVGVPVNALVVEGTGRDATHISRDAAFRMLDAMHKVASYRSLLKHECSMALQKLAGLCKGEAMVSGLPVSIASRQKSFLKSLMDALSKASVAMGCGPLQ